MVEQNNQAELNRLKALVALGRSLADPELDLDAKLQACVAELTRLVGAECGSLMLLEGENLVVRAASNPRILGMATHIQKETISTGVLRSGVPVYTKNVGESTMASLSRQGDRSRYRTGSLISLPLRAGGQVTGVLNLSDKVGAPYFDQDDLKLAQGIADQVGNLINFSAMHSRLERAYAQLGQAQKAKDDLLFLIFHDMKAPVTAVKEVLKLLRGQPDLSPEDRELYFSLAEADLEQLWRRISNLLDLNRMDSENYPLQSNPLDLAALVKESVRALAAVSQTRQVEMRISEAQGFEVMVDEDLTERIVVNLLFNALKFSSPEEGGGGWLEVRVAKQGDQALVQVTDSGPGVDPALGQEIFNRHVQGKVSKGSTGLGLYFSRRAAEMMGGSVDYRNLKQGGATFILSLPMG